MSRHGQTRRVHLWVTDAELDQRCRAAKTTRDDRICHLGGYVGLHAFEIPQICPTHVRRTHDGEQYRLRVPSGKDTAGNGGKPRDAYLPARVERDLHCYQIREDIAPDESLVDLSERRVRAIVKECAHRAADEAGDDDVRTVSSHDLRRRFAQRLLVDRQMNPRVVPLAAGIPS